MAKGTGLGHQLYVGGYEIGADVSALSTVSSPRGSQEVQGLDASAKQRLLTHTDGHIEGALWWDSATGAIHDALSSLPTADNPVLWSFGSAAGDVCSYLAAKQLDYDWTRGADGSLSGKVTFDGSGSPVEWGVQLTAGKITHASGTSTTAVDNSASSANGAACFLQLVSLGSGTVTITVEDSSDNVTFASLVAFTAVASASAPTFERKTVTGTVNQYVRVTTSGTFTDAVFIVGYRRGDASELTGLIS